MGDDRSQPALATSRVRRGLSAPYHAATRWVRRRTEFELEPRLVAIEQSIAALQAKHDSPPTNTELVAMLHEYAEAQEALLQALVDEIAELRRLVRDGT